MKKYLYILLAGTMLFSCHPARQHDGHVHEAEEAHGHIHEGHNHEAEEVHGHVHEGHNHEAEEAHGHVHDGHVHEAEEAHGHVHDGHVHEAEEAHGHVHEGHNHEAEEAHKNPDEIQLSEVRQEALGIESEAVHKSAFASVIPATGRVLAARGSESRITAPADGIVSFGKRFQIGSAVGKGSYIGSINVQSLVQADRVALIKANYETAREAFLRDSALLLQKIVTNSHFEQSRLTYIQAKSEYDALQSRQSKSGAIGIVSPLEGYLTSIDVNEGDYVATGQTLATVSTDRHLQLQVDVSAKYASQLSGVQDADIRTSSGQTFRLSEMGGRLISWSRSAQDGYLPVIFEFDNRSDVLSGQYVEALLLSPSEQETLNIPISALIEEQGAYSVFVRLDEDCFMKKAVVPGVRDLRSVEIVQGLNEGDEVVVKGAMQVKLASVSSVPAGHTHNH